ncbi:MAG: TetR/AcrR family transcriptional regulator [Tomitella sp.]|nr:TetR/AcrR family transcriptional regulator [Tomitella sp.]
MEIPTRPAGREAVRRAVLRTAQQLFSARGLRTSLREVADAAGVNLGLIHRHVGNKDALLSAVLEQGLRSGTAGLDHEDDAGEALRTMLAGALRSPDFSRLMLWLSLDPGSVGRPILSEANRPARAVQQMTAPPPASDLHLALALSVVYAWPVLRSEILDVLEIAPEQREGIDERMADLLADVVTTRRQ